MSSSLVRMKHDKQNVKVPAIPTLPTFRLLCYLGQWVLVLLILPCSASAACDWLDRDALLSLPFKTPLNWSSSTDCCLWDGVTCDPVEHRRVVRLSLPRRGLSGVVSPAITNLTRLTHLNLSHNSLLGSLPDDVLSSLPSLEVIDLSFNRLIGRFPQSSNESSHLQIINLSSNFFNGTIPASILVPSVSVFNVSNNSFSGSIPVSNGGNHTSLTFLDLSFNKFTGPIPPGIGLCSRLQTFRAGFNALDGYLPDEIFMLADLQQLSLPVNSLSGPISDGIMNLTKLRILELYSNNFFGQIPGDIGNLFRLLPHKSDGRGPLIRFEPTGQLAGDQIVRQIKNPKHHGVEERLWKRPVEGIVGKIEILKVFDHTKVGRDGTQRPRVGKIQTHDSGVLLRRLVLTAPHK